MGARNRVVEPARQAKQPGGIGFLESILELLKSLKILAEIGEGLGHRLSGLCEFT